MNNQQQVMYKTKIDFQPLFRKGDRFTLVKKNNNPDLMPIEARSIKDGWIFGFEEDELEEIKNDIL
jgi:hypothetical protein